MEIQEIISLFQAGVIDREEARQLLIALGWLKFDEEEEEEADDERLNDVIRSLEQHNLIKRGDSSEL